MVKKITFLLFLLTMSFGYAQNQTFDLTFEGTTTGSNPLLWNVFENDTNPAFEVVANPDATGINTSATVAKMTTLIAGEPWAGCETQHSSIWQWVLVDGYTTSISIDVYKTVFSDVGVKMVNTTSGSVFQILKPNTTINAWETITIDLTSMITANGENHNIDQIVIFPDWQARTTDNISYFDNISWEANKLADPVTLTCSDGIQNQDETGIDCGGTICEACPVPITSLNIDFEATTDFGSGDGATYTDLITNSVTDGINTSANSGQISACNSSAYAHVFLDIPEGIDLSTGDMGFSFKVKGSRAVPILFKLQVGADHTTNHEEPGNYTTPDVWQEVKFNLSAHITTNMSKIVLFFDITASASTDPNDDIFQIDDLVFGKYATLKIQKFEIEELTTYPNPTNDKWTFSTKDQNISSVEVFNVLGKKVISLKPNALSVSVDASNLSTGIYIATIATELGVSSRKLIKI